MSRKWTIIIIAVLFAVTAAFACFLQQKKRAYVASPYGSIPLDAGIIIEAIDLPGLFESLASDNELIAGMAEISRLRRFTEAISVIDSVTHLRQYSQVAGDNPVLLSIHLVGKNKLTPFFTLAAPPEVRDKHIRSVLGEIPGYRVTEREYQGNIVFDLIKTPGGKASLSISLVRGVIMSSPSYILVEAGIRQSDQETDIRDFSGFREVAAASGKHENKIYLVFNNLARYTELLTGRADGGISSQITNLASCLEADMYLKKTGFVMSGYIDTRDTAQILNKYRYREPGSYDIYRYIPAGAAMFEIITGTDRETAAPGKNDDTRYITDILKSQLTGEMARVYLGVEGQEAEKNKLMMFRLKGSNATEKAFREELSLYYSRQGRGNREYIISYKPDKESKYTIYKLPADYFTKEFGGSFGSYLNSGYATFYDDILVFSQEPGALSKFIYDNILNRTLANDLSYREFESTMPSRAGYYFYCVPSKILGLLDGVLKDDIVKGLEQHIEPLKKLQAVGYQFVSSNDMIYNTLSVMYKPEVREEARAVWESLLDTVALSKPLFFKNHYTGGNEIFIQDRYYNLYLINSAGRILWKRPASEAIRGNAYMIDYYRNGKLQILFATENYLHLLDRNGNYVERYPAQLRSPATNGLALFDYEDNKDYRLFICGADRKVYAYDKTGNTIRGWNQFKTAGTVTGDVEFFRVSGKDFIVVNDENNMYILDRRGNIRVEMKEQVSKSARSSLRLSGGSDPALILATREGSIKTVSFSGDVQTYTVGNFSGDPVFEYFDIDADGLGEYIFIDGNKLTAYDDDRSRMFSLSLDSENILGPYGLVFSSNDKKIGFVDAENNNIYVIDEKGKNLKGFPLSGTTPFSVGRLDRGSTYNLITGGRDNFLYNYEITR